MRARLLGSRLRPRPVAFRPALPRAPSCSHSDARVPLGPLAFARAFEWERGGMDGADEAEGTGERAASWEFERSETAVREYNGGGAGGARGQERGTAARAGAGERTRAERCEDERRVKRGDGCKSGAARGEGYKSEKESVKQCLGGGSRLQGVERESDTQRTKRSAPSSARPTSTSSTTRSTSANHLPTSLSAPPSPPVSHPMLTHRRAPNE